MYFWMQMLVLLGVVYLGRFICAALHRPCSTGKYFFQWDQQWMTQRTKAQEISMGQLVMSKSGSISMLLESCHPSICSLHFTFIHFKSTDMRLPADWLWAIFSCSGLVLSQCLGYVNNKIKLFHMQTAGALCLANVNSHIPAKRRLFQFWASCYSGGS